MKPVAVKALSTILRPFDAVLRRLPLGLKLALVLAVLLAPCVFLAFAFRDHQGGQIDFSAKERTGVAYLRDADALLNSLVRKRITGAGDTAASARALAATDERLGAQLGVTDEHAAVAKALQSGDVP